MHILFSPLDVNDGTIYIRERLSIHVYMCTCLHMRMHYFISILRSFTLYMPKEYLDKYFDGYAIAPIGVLQEA